MKSSVSIRSAALTGAMAAGASPKISSPAFGVSVSLMADPPSQLWLEG
jgi:hypothetical protein